MLHQRGGEEEELQSIEKPQPQAPPPQSSPQEGVQQVQQVQELQVQQVQQELQTRGDEKKAATAASPAATSAAPAPPSAAPSLAPAPPIVVWLDGCFDFMHFGHANAIRQAKALFPESHLIVGVHSDQEILRFKGPTVMNEQERYAAVRACRWVDEVAEDVPYVTKLDLLRSYHVDHCVHGDDLTFDENGRDSYWEIRQAGLMRIVRRTHGISTTDLVNRLLALAKAVNLKIDDKEHDWDQYIQRNAEAQQHLPMQQNRAPEGDDASLAPETRVRQFLPTVAKIAQFASGIRDPPPCAKIVYVDGAFDLFHIGHIEFLREARKMGDYLIVGLHEDSVINKHKGATFPIMNLHERMLNVLSCRFVDNVVIGAPFVVTEDLIKSLNISLVVTGTVKDPWYEIDAYQLPKKLGIFKELQSPLPLTTHHIVERIIKNMLAFVERNKKKKE